MGELWLAVFIFLYTLWYIICASDKRTRIHYESWTYSRFSMLGLCITLLFFSCTSTTESLSPYFSKNIGLMYFELLITLLTIFHLCLSWNYNMSVHIKRFEYHISMLVNLFSILMLIQTVDIVCFIVFMELMSISAVLLCTTHRSGLLATEAALKYFLLSAVSSLIVILGLSFIYGATGSSQFSDILYILRTSITSEYQQIDVTVNSGIMPHTTFSMLYNIGICCVVIGFLFKLYVFPAGFWIIDIYEGAPTSITFYLAVVYYLSMTYVFLKIYHVLIADFFHTTDTLFYICGVASILMSIGAAYQQKIKSFLAHSSMGYSGYLYLACASHSITLLEDSFKLTVWYAITLSGFFALLLELWDHPNYLKHGQYRAIVLIDDMAPLLRDRRKVAYVYALLMCSLSGLPPFAGFFVKIGFLGSLLSAGMNWLVLFLVLCTATTVYAYARIVAKLYNKVLTGAPGTKSLTNKNVLYARTILLCTVLVLHTPDYIVPAVESMFYGNIIYWPHKPLTKPLIYNFFK